MKNYFLYCNSRKKKIKCFGVCDLNDTLYLSPPWVDLSLSLVCAPALSLKFLSDGERKAERDQDIF